MATITGSGSAQNEGYYKHTWEGLGAGDDGKPVLSAMYADRSVQVTGTFAGGTVTVEGSNDGGTTWAGLNDPKGNAISLTAAGLVGLLEYTEMIRPKVTGGDSGDTTDLDVSLVSRKPV